MRSKVTKCLKLQTSFKQLKQITVAGIFIYHGLFSYSVTNSYLVISYKW